MIYPHRNRESLIQEACVNFFRMQYPHIGNLLFAIPNGGFRSKRTAEVLKKEGTLRGVADLFLSYPSKGYHGLYIEMKAPADPIRKKRKGQQSKEQKEFEKDVTEHGYIYAVCYSLDEFRKTVATYIQ